MRIPHPLASVARPAVAGLLALLALVATAATALADGGIEDSASIFSPAGAQVALAHIQKIGADTGVDVHVVAVNHLSGGRDVGTEAQQVFDAQHMRGVLLYVSKDDRQIAVHVGPDATSALGLQEQMAIRDAVIAGFRQGDFDGGLLAGIDRIGRDVQDLRVGRVSTSNPTAVAPAAVRRGAGFTWASVPLVGAVGALAAFVWVRRGSRPRAHASPELVVAAMEADRLAAEAGSRASGEPAAAVPPPGHPVTEAAPEQRRAPSADRREDAREAGEGQEQEAADMRRRAEPSPPGDGAREGYRRG